MYILENIIGSVFFGGVIALILTALVFLACMMISRKTLQNTIAILVIGGYFIYATVISSFVVGGFYAKSRVGEVGEYVETLVEDNIENPSSEDIEEIKNDIVETYQSYGSFLNTIDFKDVIKSVRLGATASSYFVNLANDKIDDYIERWIMWLLFGTLMATILSAAVAKNGDNKSTSNISNYGFDNDTSSSEYY